MNGPWLDAVRRDLDVFGDDPGAGRWESCLARLCSIASERGVVNDRSLPVRFVDARGVQSPAYELHVWRTGEVPTRTSGAGAWHDFFNALVWLAMPRTKARLNRLQAAELERDGIAGTRGPVRDAATLFDENAAVVLARDESTEARLRSHDWPDLFVRERARFERDVRVVAFGHALLDKLRAPYKGVCAHAWVVAGDRAAALVDAAAAAGCVDPVLQEIDGLVAGTLDARALRPRAFTPLPVLGIPGWWAENTRIGFYDDGSVFRPPRSGRGPARPSPSSATSRR